LLPDPPKLPAFTGPAGPDGHAAGLTTFEQKAEALATKFFPSPPADLNDIHNITFEEPYDQLKFEIKEEVRVHDIAKVLKKMGS